MTIKRKLHRNSIPSMLLTVALALLPVSGACAWQSAPQPVIKPVPVVVAPAPGVQFQQTVQQQQVRDELQKSQLEQQLHQSVSDNAKRPGANHRRLQRQLGAADRAQADRERAAQQARLDRYRNQAALPRVIPQSLPASARSGN
jgi:hypothetical protein